MRKVAHSLHFPIDVTIRIVLHVLLVSYTTSHILGWQGKGFATKHKAEHSRVGVAGAGGAGRGCPGELRFRQLRGKGFCCPHTYPLRYDWSL